MAAVQLSGDFRQLLRWWVDTIDLLSNNEVSLIRDIIGGGVVVVVATLSMVTEAVGVLDPELKSLETSKSVDNRVA